MTAAPASPGLELNFNFPIKNEIGGASEMDVVEGAVLLPKADFQCVAPLDLHGDGRGESMQGGGDQGGGGDARPAGQRFAFDAAFVSSSPDLVRAKHVNEVGVRTFGREMGMETYFVAKVLDHRFVRVRDKDDGVRNAGVEGVNRFQAGGKLNFFVQAKISRGGQIDLGPIGGAGGGDDAGSGFESGSAVGPGLPLNIAGKTTGAIPAHIRRAAFAGDQEEQAIRTDAALAMAQFDDILCSEVDVPFPIIDQHEVVSGSVHLGKTNQHWSATYWREVKLER